MILFHIKPDYQVLVLSDQLIDDHKESSVNFSRIMRDFLTVSYNTSTNLLIRLSTLPFGDNQ